MNPPSALHSAMSRERKPFTYTPGGIDLSEIKSERMAQRLMRNAMNPGVSEVRSPTIQSPPTPSTPVAVPNFSCLPIQVFPSFTLPANPKSLLRTRSNPNQTMSQLKNLQTSEQNFIQRHKDNDLKSVNENIVFQKPTEEKPKQEYTVSGNVTEILNINTDENINSNIYEQILPPISFDAEYLQVLPKENITDINYNLNKYANGNDIKQTTNDSVPKTRDKKEDVTSPNNDEDSNELVEEPENENENNGSVEAAITVKLPTKKSSAKTETKVEVQKRTLPDGSIEEVTKTTTKTTIDGRTEIKTKTETKTIPVNADDEGEETEEYEEEEDASEVEEEIELNNNTITIDNNLDAKSDAILVGEERSETSITTTNKITIAQDDSLQGKELSVNKVDVNAIESNKTIENKNDDLETEESATEQNTTETSEIKISDSEENTTQQESNIKEEENIVDETNVDCTKETNDENQNDLEETLPNKEETIIKCESEIIKTVAEESEIAKDDEESEYTEEEISESEETEDSTNKTKLLIEETKQPENNLIDKKNNIENDTTETSIQNSSPLNEEEKNDISKDLSNSKEESDQDKTILIPETTNIETISITNKETQNKESTETKEIDVLPEVNKAQTPIEQEINIPIKVSSEQEINIPIKVLSEQEINIPIKESSVPLEKIEDVEIKPIKPILESFTRSKSENSEVTTSTSQGSGSISTQTEYNRTENITVTNRTINTLDKSYEQLANHGVPTLKTYFAPPNRERVSISPSRPYEPRYATTQDTKTERRHSLLLDRLSVDRQIPSSDTHYIDIKYNNPISDQQQISWPSEPQSEVLNVSNVKPSTITKDKQQWYQQGERENVIYNNVNPNTSVPMYKEPSQQWPQHQQHQSNMKQSYEQIQTSENQYQSQTPQKYYQPLNQYQVPTQQQHINQASQYHDQYQYQVPSQNQQNYQSLNNYEKQTDFYETHTDKINKDYLNSPKPNSATNLNYTSPAVPWGAKPASSANSSSNLLYSGNEYTKQNPSAYVPPPWEQEPSFTPNLESNMYQSNMNTPLPQNTPQSWKPTTPVNKYPKVTSYVPPAPNQSFVKPVVYESPKTPGRKTYYSEYERRYISVPESTYVPGDAKYQPQSQYTSDTNEQDRVEHEWRKELREFTEKSTQVQYENQSSQPPWEDLTKYEKPSPAPFTSIGNNTQTWSQTIRPRTWREKSYEPEYLMSQEWPKTEKGRPLSYVHSNTEIKVAENTRGVSVDRYNPNIYHSPVPSEHPPVQSQTLTVEGAKKHYNPHISGYPVRASVEPKEQPASSGNPRMWGDSRLSPVQSRSFKYLQWITGTEN